MFWLFWQLVGIAIARGNLKTRLVRDHVYLVHNAVVLLDVKIYENFPTAGVCWIAGASVLGELTSEKGRVNFRWFSVVAEDPAVTGNINALEYCKS
jgi:hypothetical protein